MQNIMLGNKELGSVNISVLSHSWGEYPKLSKDRLKSDAPIYIEVDKDNFNVLSEFYREVVQGDMTEGIASKQSMYWELIYVKDGGKLISKFEFKTLYPFFEDFITSEIEEEYTYIISIT